MTMTMIMIIVQEGGKMVTTPLHLALQDLRLHLVAGKNFLLHINVPEFRLVSSIGIICFLPNCFSPPFIVYHDIGSIITVIIPRYSSLLSSLYRAPGAPWPPTFLRSPPTEVRLLFLVIESLPGQRGLKNEKKKYYLTRTWSKSQRGRLKLVFKIF